MCANLVPIGCHAIIHTKHVTAQDASLGACPGELEILTVNFLANTPHEKERWLTKLGTLIAARGPAARGAQSGAAAGLGEVTGVRAPDEEEHAPQPPVNTDAVVPAEKIEDAATPITPPRVQAPLPVESQPSVTSLASSISDV